MPSPRLPLPAAHIDPAFIACLNEAINTPELIRQHDRLYGSTLMSRATPIERMVDKATGKTVDDMRAFVEFVHRCIYLTLDDAAIEALRTPKEPTNA
ncbi:hypothetical protein [Castellaniella sp.]|uniref:hypothetical protein n=1 Tax=Castellaniella sp. TaxID=1955812 RepID=UPI002AFF5809|nr:hypothetical protein [Castellaniella sp.]